MQVHDLAAARAQRPARRETPEGSSPSFGKVYEIETARRARNASIPPSVMEEMDAADALFESLQDDGAEVRFTQVGGRVVATLCDLDGDVIRPLGLREVLGLDIDPDAAA
jgi:hypothetical protein